MFSRRLLLQMARMEMDWNLQKLGQLFSSFSATSAKITNTNYYG